MKFKVDENLPAELLDDLRAAGHEAETVLDEGLTGAPDSIVLRKAHAEGWVLLTMDKGIADIRAYPPESYSGIILFRPPTSGRGTVLAFVRRHLLVLLQADLADHLLIITDRSIRCHFIY
jgi:predicted nuclease of predicted toxin-antitoxin system